MPLYTKNNLWLLFVVLFSLSCTKSYSPSEFAEFSSSPDFTKSTSNEVFEVRCTYLPPEIVTINELYGKTKKSICYSEFVKKYEFSKNAYLFKVQLIPISDQNILLYNLRSNNEYSKRINYFNYSFKDDIFLMEGEKLIKAGNHLFENNFGGSNMISFVFSFPRDSTLNLNDDIQLVFSDKIFTSKNFTVNFPKELFQKYKIKFSC